MAGTDIVNFLSIVRQGWNVVIGTQGAKGNLTSLRIADRRTPNNFIDIAVQNNMIDDQSIWNAAKFLSNVDGNTEQKFDALLWAMGIAFNADKPGELPHGLEWQADANGALAINDEDGNQLGMVEEGASMSDKQEAVMKSVAQKAAAGLEGSNSSSIPPSSKIMQNAAKSVMEDYDYISSEMEEIPVAKDIPKMPANEQRAMVNKSLTNVYVTAFEALGSLFGGAQNSHINVTQFRDMCERNELQFTVRTSSQDPQVSIFFIETKAGDDQSSGSRLLAAGRTTRLDDGSEAISYQMANDVINQASTTNDKFVEDVKLMIPEDQIDTLNESAENASKSVEYYWEFELTDNPDDHEDQGNDGDDKGKEEANPN